MADKGDMIELQINPNRITQLAQLHQNTSIVEPGFEACIVSPAKGDFAVIAAQLQHRLTELTGRELCVKDEADFRNPDGLSAPIIAVGHAGCNMLLRSLHYLGFLEHGLTTGRWRSCSATRVVRVRYLACRVSASIDTLRVCMK